MGWLSIMPAATCTGRPVSSQARRQDALQPVTNVATAALTSAAVVEISIDDLFLERAEKRFVHAVGVRPVEGIAERHLPCVLVRPSGHLAGDVWH
jgi:hypothetical protein